MESMLSKVSFNCSQFPKLHSVASLTHKGGRNKVLSSHGYRETRGHPELRIMKAQNKLCTYSRALQNPQRCLAFQGSSGLTVNTQIPVYASPTLSSRRLRRDRVCGDSGHDINQLSKPPFAASPASVRTRDVCPSPFHLIA